MFNNFTQLEVDKHFKRVYYKINICKIILKTHKFVFLRISLVLRVSIVY